MAELELSGEENRTGNATFVTPRRAPKPLLGPNFSCHGLMKGDSTNEENYLGNYLSLYVHTERFFPVCRNVLS